MAGKLYNPHWNFTVEELAMSTQIETVSLVYWVFSKES